jgi:type III secretion system YscJ/HrcJ family lipoprotein
MKNAHILLARPAAPQRSKPIFLWLVTIVAVLLLAGCNRESVRNGMTEDQANEMVAVLILHDVVAKKVAHDKGMFEVNVPNVDIGYALQVVRQYQLPRDINQSPTCRIFKKDSMISAPIEDRARWMCSKSLELEKAILHGIDGVVTVTARVSYGERDALSDKTDPPHASIAIKHRRDARIDVDKIKAIAKDSNAGIEASNVSVNLFEADVIPRQGYAPSVDSAKTGTPISASWVGAVGLIVLLAGFALWLNSSGFVANWRAKRTAKLPVVADKDQVPAEQPAQGD